MNNLYVIGKIYWILRDISKPKDRVFSKGFMRQTSPPWLTGSGIQIRFGKYTLQIGICGKPRSLDDQDGLLYAIQGRLMDTEIREIGEWR